MTMAARHAFKVMGLIGVLVAVRIVLLESSTRRPAESLWPVARGARSPSVIVTTEHTGHGTWPDA
jgi:hypothetical protein